VTHYILDIINTNFIM